MKAAALWLQPVVMNFDVSPNHKPSQKVTEASKRIFTQLVTFADVSQNWLGPLSIHYMVIQYPQQMIQMAFCDLSHTFYKQVANVPQSS